MKLFKKLIILILIQTIAFSSVMPVKAASGSASLSVSSSSVNVGDTVTVTLSITINPLFGVVEYNVAADANLRLISGTSHSFLLGDGSGTTKSVTLTYEAVSTGSASISATITDPRTYDDEEVSISPPRATIKVTSGSNNSSSGTGTTTTTPTETQDETKSSNNYLSGLSIEGVTLNPEFNKDTTSYNVSLPEGTTSINVSATAEDDTASISGTGDIDVETGNNTINIDVKAENGSIKTYTIFATVKQPALATLDSSGISYGVIAIPTEEIIPDGFTESTIKINETEVPCYINETLSLTLLYLSNDESVDGFYIYNETDGSVYQYMEITHADKILVSLPISNELLNREGFIASELELQGNVIQVVQYAEDTALANELYILYVVNPEGERLLYEYDKTEGTLQRYYNSSNLNKTELDNLLAEHDQELKSKMMITNIFIGIVIVLLLLLGFVIYKHLKLNKSVNKEIDTYNDEEEEEYIEVPLENDDGQ